MGLIDCEIYIGRYPFGSEFSCELEDAIAALRRAGVTKSIAGPMDGIFDCDNIKTNADFFDAVSAHSDLICPVLVLDPTKSGWQEAIDQFGEQCAAVGLFPRVHQYEPLNENLRALYDKIGQIRKPIVISLNLVDERSAPAGLKLSPPLKVEDLIELAEKYPTVNFIFAGAKNHEFNGLLSAKRENIFVTISFLEGEGMLEKFVRDSYTEKILFGSHFPFFYIEASIAKLTDARLTAEAVDVIAHKNAKRLPYI